MRQRHSKSISFRKTPSDFFPDVLLLSVKSPMTSDESYSVLSALLPPEVFFYFGVQHGIIAVIVLEDDAMFEEGDT